MSFLIRKIWKLILPCPRISCWSLTSHSYLWNGENHMFSLPHWYGDKTVRKLIQGLVCRVSLHWMYFLLLLPMPIIPLSNFYPYIKYKCWSSIVVSDLSTDIASFWIAKYYRGWIRIFFFNHLPQTSHLWCHISFLPLLKVRSLGHYLFTISQLPWVSCLSSV